jgi:hypothetical protein
VIAFNGFRNTDAPLAAALNDDSQLSPRSAGLSIFALSLLGWAVVLVPLWAAVR